MDRQILSQLQPFNEARFDSAIALLSCKHNRALSKYEIAKLHVLMDVFHTIEHGVPIVGGNLDAWALGPVINEAYDRLEGWCDQLEYENVPPKDFIIKSEGNRRYLFPTFKPDPDDFSKSETVAMDRAWDLLMSMLNKGYEGYQEAKAYFHSNDTFIGRAYNKARLENRPMDWHEVIDAYDELHATNHSQIKTLLQC